MNLFKVSMDTEESLFDANPGDRKYTRNYPVSMDAEMYSLLQELARHPDLPFNGNGSALARQMFAGGIEALREFLEGGNKSTWQRLKEQQRLLTAERYALHINELIDKQVEALRLWTAAAEWSAVLDDLQTTYEMVSGYPSNHWRRYAARQWQSNKGLRELFREWEDVMREEAPLTWSKVRGVFEQMNEVAGL